MKLDEETLIEIEDYISHLAETVGLSPDTIIDVDKAISNYKKTLTKCEKSPSGKHEFVLPPDSFDSPYCKHCYCNS